MSVPPFSINQPTTTQQQIIRHGFVGRRMKSSASLLQQWDKAIGIGNFSIMYTQQSKTTSQIFMVSITDSRTNNTSVASCQCQHPTPNAHQCKLSSEQYLHSSTEIVPHTSSRKNSTHISSQNQHQGQNRHSSIDNSSDTKRRITLLK